MRLPWLRHKDQPAVLHLPVVEARRPGAARATPRVSSIAKWRAASLITVHLLMVAHVIYWWVTGRAVAPFVYSESMKTLELGEINPGFLMFVLALLATAVFGRFMCGWVCHMGALQDLCAWILRKFGLRPRLFRARLLGYLPLTLAIYMFIWPTLKREAILPLLNRIWPGAPDARPFPGFSYAMTTDSIWEGLPGAWVAVPFLLACGFAMVYFLGARGMCRYGCPYGGLLLPAESLAIGRIVVDPTKCDQCGLCTAACTSGVRVHDEIRDHGSVTDRNCIRSFDCVGACPTRALSYAFRKPSALEHHEPKKYDLTWGEELIVGAACISTFFVTRGLYNIIPMLFAATIAALSGYIAWKCIRLARSRNLTLGIWQLRLNGRIKPAGWALVIATVLISVVLAHSTVVRLALVLAGRMDDRVTTSYAEALAGNVPQAQRELAARALTYYDLARPIGEGGIALAPTPDVGMRSPWLLIVLGRKDEAVTRLLGHLAHTPSDEGVEQAARLLFSLNRVNEAESLLSRHASASREFPDSRDLLAQYQIQSGRSGVAETMYREAIARGGKDPRAHAGLGTLLVRSGRSEEGLKELKFAATDSPRDPDVRREYAICLYTLGRVEDALSELEAGANARPTARQSLLSLGATMLQQVGRVDDARAWGDRANAAR